MPLKNNIITQLTRPDYVPVMKDADTSYGGSQMWFSIKHRYSKDTILHNCGCGTIATADMFLYLALSKEALQTPVTNLALHNQEINYPKYDYYVRIINNEFTKTLPIIGVLGPSVASAINSYSDLYGLGLQAAWKWTLNYYDMYEIIEEMLQKDIPVILSIGPNTPNLWGKKGISFYEIREIDYKETTDVTTDSPKPYYYKAVKHDINSHYVTVTALIKDEVTGKIMLRISSWGKQYYINYEEYRDYIESTGGTFTSSLAYVKQKYFNL